MNKLIFWFLLLILNIIISSINGEINCLNESDKLRLRKIVELKAPLSENNISNIYYYVNLRSHLDKNLSDAPKICEHLKTISATTESLEQIYFISSISKIINCPVDTTKFSSKIQSSIKDDSSVLDLYRAGLSLSNMAKPIDSTRFSKLLIEALKRDDNLLNSGLAFQLASKFNKVQDQNVFAEKIPDVIVQADEVNGKHLQFEGGLGVSAAVIRGIYQLTTVTNKPISITNEQAIKFVNYFLSRKFVLTPKGASEVIEILSMFTNNKYHIPYLITKYGSSAISQENPILTLKVTNVLGETVGPLTVTGTSLQLANDPNNAPVMKNIQFKPVEGDSTLFAYDFFTKPPTPASGFYQLSVNAIAQKSDSRILGNTGAKIGLSILTRIKIDQAELTITDVDVGTKNYKLTYPSSIEQLTDVDYLQRFQLKFQIKDQQTDKLIDVHQAFLRFYHLETKQEIIFISELDSNSFHKIDLNLQTRSKDFNELSGKYQINLFIGDPLIMAAQDWKIGTINIQFAVSSTNTIQQQQQSKSEYLPKPEITHIFREPEKRPHALISNFFTFLVLVPLIGLFVAWFKIGINLSNMPFSISFILFHGSLAGIFLLYGCFFLKLDMFQTIKYLCGFSIIIYLSGHSLLSSLIRKKL